MCVRARLHSVEHSVEQNAHTGLQASAASSPQPETLNPPKNTCSVASGTCVQKITYGSLPKIQPRIDHSDGAIVCMLDRYFAHKAHFAATCNALQLTKGLRHRMWPDTAQQCRQLPHVGHLIATRLAAAGVGDLRCAIVLCVCIV